MHKTVLAANGGSAFAVTALLAFPWNASMQGGPLWWVSFHRKQTIQAKVTAMPTPIRRSTVLCTANGLMF